MLVQQVSIVVKTPSMLLKWSYRKFLFRVLSFEGHLGRNLPLFRPTDLGASILEIE